MSDLPPPVPEFPLISPPAPDAPVTSDSPCRKCGYNLRGLRSDGVCPECATPVGVSILGDLLRFSDPAWLRKVAQGMGLVLVGFYLQFGFVILGMVLAGLRSRYSATLIMVGALASHVLNFVGTWLLTIPDPSGIGEDKHGSIRKIVRVTLAITLANAITSNLPQLLVLPLAIHQMIVLVSVIVTIATVIGLWAQLTYLMALADRLPDPKLVSALRQVRIGLVTLNAILLLLSGIIQIAVLFGHLPPQGGAVIGFGCFTGLLGLAAIGYYIAYLFQIHSFRRKLYEQAFFADQVWAAKAVPAPAQNRAAGQPPATEPPG
jgi:hypothetical protein